MDDCYGEFPDMRNNNTKRIAASAILSALAAVLLFIGSILDILDLTCAAAASLSTAFAAEELKGKYPLCVWAVASALALFLMPSSTAVMYYAVFIGFYPLLKNLLEKLPGILALFLKFLLFNAAVTALFFLARWVFLDEGTEAGALAVTLVYVLSNIFFAAYDLALGNLLKMYRRHFRKVWRIDRYL